MKRFIHQHTSATSQKKKPLWPLTAFFGVAIILIFVGIRIFSTAEEPVTIDSKPEEFSLVTFTGESINTGDLRGKIVLVNFWSSWCSTCSEGALLLEEAWQGYQSIESTQVVFLGVAYMDTEPAARDFIEDHNVTYPTGLDLKSAISKTYRVDKVPETFILDKEGIVRFIKIGTFSSTNEIIQAVESVASPPGN